MDGYRSLAAWQAAQELCLKTLEATDGPMHRRAWTVVDQLRRAAVSADVNIVEGYALGTAPLFRRHARIALGSAAEAQRLLVISAARAYLPEATTTLLQGLADQAVRRLYGLVRTQNLPFAQPPRKPRPPPPTANR
jgi:four helix bundle protein